MIALMLRQNLVQYHLGFPEVCQATLCRTQRSNDWDLHQMTKVASSHQQVKRGYLPIRTLTLPHSNLTPANFLLKLKAIFQSSHP